MEAILNLQITLSKTIPDIKLKLNLANNNLHKAITQRLFNLKNNTTFYIYPFIRGVRERNCKNIYLSKICYHKTLKEFLNEAYFNEKLGGNYA